MFRRSLPAVLLLCLASTGLPAQHTLIYATLSGRVTDLAGASVSGATVTVLESETLTSQSVRSDRSGNFRFAHLPNGQYEVTVHQAYYRDTTQTVTVHAGEAADLSIAMATTDEPPAIPRGQWALESPHHPAESPSTGLLDAPGLATSLVRSGEAGGVPEEDTWPGLDGIQEFRVIAGADPRASGLLTRGLGPLHGEIYAASGNTLAAWNGVQPTTRLPWVDFRAALGSSVNRNRSSYFFGLDRQSLGRPANSAVAGANSADESLDATSSSHKPLNSSQLLARLDRHLSERDSAHIRYSRSNVGGDGMQANAPGLRATQQSGTVDNTIAISPGTVNETRGQLVAGSVQVPGGEPAHGISSNLPTARRFKVYEAADNISHQMERQALHAGADFLFNQMTVSFLEGSSGNASFAQSSRTAAFYAQDQWKMNQSLVFTAGIRYDLEFLRNLRTDTDNLAPQVGFAWSPGGSRSTVIRGGYGLMYEQLPLPAISGAVDGASNAVDLMRAGTFAAGRNSVPLGELGNFDTVNPSIQNAYAEMANLEFEQQVGPRSTFSASYQHVRGVELALPASSGVPLCAAAGGCNTENEFQGARQYNSGSSSSYDGLTVAFVQHPVQWGDYRVAYTYADGQSSAGSVYDTFVGDQMRRIAFTSTLHTPFNSGSGLWQHFTHGLALSGYGDFTRRNELPGLDFIHLNAQLTKSFALGTRIRLELIAQTSDMLEHRNYSTAKAISELGEYGGEILSSYARFAAVGTPNGTQAGLRLKF